VKVILESFHLNTRSQFEAIFELKYKDSWNLFIYQSKLKHFKHLLDYMVLAVLLLYSSQVQSTKEGRQESFP